MRPRRYQNDAAGIAETFAGGSPIIVDLAMMQDAEVRRLIDFMSGLVKGLDGNIRPVATKVFLLTPAGIEQFDDELDQNSLRLHEDEEFPV
jgi:cell division inhibitor SepF